MEDMIDITPKGVFGGVGQKGRGNTVFQEQEMWHIEENPRGLTKEGVEESIEIWKKSNNRHVMLKFITMGKRCKTLTPSGKTPLGEIILARDAQGNPTWVKDTPETLAKKRAQLSLPTISNSK